MASQLSSMRTVGSHNNISSINASCAGQKQATRLCWGPATTAALLLTALTLWQATSATVGHSDWHALLAVHVTPAVLKALQQQLAVGGEPVKTAWQQLEQQRLGRLTTLLQELTPRPSTANPAWALLNLLVPKTADPFSATLSWYSSTQRPRFAASDLQLLLFLQAADVSDFFFEGDAAHITSDPAYETTGAWAQITEHLGHGSTADSSASKFHQAVADSPTARLQLVSDVPQTARHRRLTAAANSRTAGSGSSSNSGTKTTSTVTRAMPTGYITSVTEEFSGISVDSSSSSSSKGPETPSVLAASEGQVQWPNVTQAGSMQQGQQIPYRIIGGQEAPLNRFKWACSLRAANDFHYCGCSLIAPSVVLTAAHCLNHPESEALSKPWVEVGRYYLTGTNQTEGNDYDRIKCVKNVVHNGWSFTTGLNDIALCFLESSSRFTPVKLAAATNDVTVGQQLTVMGWGAQSEGARNSPKLMEVNVNVVSTDSCNAAYKGAVRDTQICAGLPQGGADACQGDSGGPLIVEGSSAADDVQVGIVSYGVGCGRPNTPGVYTDVSKYRSFVKEQLLANGVVYTPLTDNTPVPDSATALITSAAATINRAKPKDACACSVDGFSGSMNVGLTGCKQHGLDFGDTSYYCYAQGGKSCASATTSNAYPGAAWLDCDPKAQQSSKPTTAAPAVTATSSSPETGTTGSSSSSSKKKPAASTGSSLAGMALQALQSWMFNAAALPSGGNSTIVRAATP